MENASFSKYVEVIYRGVLGRDPDPTGLQHYVSRLAAGVPVQVLIDDLLGSDEYRDKPTHPPKLDLPLGAIDRPITIVDIGAQKLAEEEHIYAPLLREGVPWRCVGFEPLEDKRRERSELESDPRLQMVDAFIGDGRSHFFNELTDSGSSSLLELNAEFCSHFDHISGLRLVRTTPAKTKTLDKALIQLPWIDFLKLDIQGFEYSALKRATSVLKRTSVVHCECLFGPMYKRQGYFSDIDQLLRSLGFEFIDFSHLARYRYVKVAHPSHAGERAIWGDAVFFRPLCPGRNSLATCVAQALIADAVYGKPGLAQTVMDAL